MSGYLQIISIGNSLDVAAARLAGVPGGLDRALRDASQRASSHLKTTASRKARERYAISAGNISKSTPKINISVGGGSAHADITWTGTKFALSKFSGSSNTPAWDTSRKVRIKKPNARNGNGGFWAHPGKEGKGHVLKSTSPMTISGSFVAQFSSGHAGIFHRTGGATDSGAEKIEESMGLSVPQMVGSDAIKDEIGEAAMDRFEERLADNVNRLLGI